MDDLQWDGLSMRERAAYIRDAVSRGIFDIDNIRQEYNEFKKGGNTQKPPQKYIYDELPRLLREAGLDVKVSSGYRKAGAVGTAGNRSWHPRHGAVDIVPQGNTTFEDIEYALHNNPVIRQYMLSNNFGLLDESGRTPESRATMHRTGATGPHFHIGRDSKPAALYRQRVGALQPTEDRKVVYFTNPFIPIPEPEQTIEPIITESQIIDNPIPSQVPEQRTIPEEQVAYEQEIPEVVVAPERKLYIRPDQMLAQMNEMVTPYTPIKYSTQRSPSVADRLAQINNNRVTLLQKDLEDSIIRNNLLDIQNPEKLRRDAEDLRFYRNMSALGGNLFSGEENHSQQMITTGGAGYIPSNYGQGAIDYVRRKLYDNILPWGYNDIPQRVYNVVVKNKKEEDETRDRAIRDNLFATYLQIPNSERHTIEGGKVTLTDARYKPKGAVKGKPTYRFTKLTPAAEYGILAYAGQVPGGLNIEGGDYLPIGKNRVVYPNDINAFSELEGLGQFTVGRGYDKKGEYVSYYDSWDLGDTNSPYKDLSLGIGKPFNIYDRIYLDDYYGVKEPTHATYLPEVIITGKKRKALGGNLFPKGGPMITVNPGDRVFTDQCALWSNSLLRDNGYLINGNAWNLGNVDLLYNGFEGLDRPENYDLPLVKQYNHSATDNVLRNFDSKTLDVNKPYVVNMFYNDSPSQEDAYNNGKGVTGTHTGLLTYDEPTQKWWVTHNIHGNIHQEPFIDLQNSKGKYGVTAIYEPRKANLWNKAKGLLGFADGGQMNPIEYMHQRFPITEQLDVHPLFDSGFTPRDIGDFGDIEYMQARYDNLPYYNNYSKPDSLKGKSVIVYNDRLGEGTNEAIALDALSHGLREQDSVWREQYIPTLLSAFREDANYFADQEGIPQEYRQEYIDGFIDGKIRDMVVKDSLRKQLNYQPKQSLIQEYRSMTPEQQNALTEAYSYIFPTQLNEVIVNGKRR